MFMSILSRLLSAWFVFLLPGYATWKVLQLRPLPEPDVHRWMSYWTVVGTFMAFEYATEWFISWFPFYWEIKTIFLLYLALPQTQGSAYVYATYLQPFFFKNQAELDQGITAAQGKALAFIQGKLAALWALVSRQDARGQPANASPQLSFLNNAWSSALNTFGAAATQRAGPRPPLSTQASDRSSSSQAAPPFPVPQHS